MDSRYGILDIKNPHVHMFTFAGLPVAVVLCTFIRAMRSPTKPQWVLLHIRCVVASLSEVNHFILQVPPPLP